jgi:hypothetical protein
MKQAHRADGHAGTTGTGILVVDLDWRGVLLPGGEDRRHRRRPGQLNRPRHPQRPAARPALPARLDRHRRPRQARRVAAAPGEAAGRLRGLCAGKITGGQLEAAQDEAVRDSISRFEATGSPIISDGEQRASSFATYPVADTLAGTGLAGHLSAEGGQYFAIFADGHPRQLPRLTGGPVRYKTYAADNLRKSIGYAAKPVKQAVIAPSMLLLLYPLNGPVPGYSREQFEDDIVAECEKDIRRAFGAGAARVSIDFTEGRLAARNDPRNPWTQAGLLRHFVELNNAVLARFTPAERARIGIHTCPAATATRCTAPTCRMPACCPRCSR